MYKKKIKIGDRIYNYYYHNIKEKGRVKNIFLGDNKELALNKLNQIKEERTLKELINDAPSPIETIGNTIETTGRKSNNLIYFIILLITFVVGLSMFYYENITGFITYEQNTIKLDVNNYVARNSSVYVNVFGLEKSKLIDEMINFDNETLYINSLDVNINEFNFTLSPGTYNFIASLIDNNNLLAIASKEIIIESIINGSLQENITQSITINLPEITINMSNTSSPKNFALINGNYFLIKNNLINLSYVDGLGNLGLKGIIFQNHALEINGSFVIQTNVTLAKFDNLGNLYLKGSLFTYQILENNYSNSFIIQLNNSNLAVFDNLGNLHLKGSLIENAVF